MLVPILTCFVSTISLALDILMFLMFLRAVISWFPNLAETSFGNFLYTVTEWVIMPVRGLFEMMGLDRPSVIDVPFFVTFILLSIVSSIL